MPRPIQSTAPNEDTVPKYVHLANQLGSRIRSGEWENRKVPTVREIALAYEVSSFTASRALHLLEDQGLVVNKDRSGCYVVSAEPEPAAASRWALVLRVSPGAWREASEAVVRVGFGRVGEGRDVFAPVALDPPPGATPSVAEAVAREIAAGGAGGVFFLPSRVSDEARRVDEWFLAGCRREGLPVVLIDRNLRGENRPLEYDLVASDHFDGGRACTEHLLGLGRKAVACVVASPTSTHNDRLAGYLYALQAAGGLTPRVLRVPEGLDAREVYPWLAEEAARVGADGVVCYQDYTAVGLILELFRRGVRVPRDVAVVGCDDLPIGNSFSLGVTTYSYPSEAIARTALRVMRTRAANPDDPAAKILLPGRLVVRDSTQGG